MIDIAVVNRTSPALSGLQDMTEINIVRPAFSRNTIENVNLGKQVTIEPECGPTVPVARASAPSAGPSFVPSPAPDTRRAPAPGSTLRQAVPMLIMPEQIRPVLRGQKTPLGLREGARALLRVSFGWNVKDPRCDIDASAFLLGADGRVPSDEWFVFYGQPASPDGSVRLSEDGQTDRQVISVDLGRLSASIQRIVFVMTINEALENGLNFGMIREAWLRVLEDSGREKLSYRPEDLYPGITSMTLGEIYLHRGEWRFNPVGNGMNVDLAGQCAVYGVEIGE